MNVNGVAHFIKDTKMSVTLFDKNGREYKCTLYPIDHSTTPRKAGVYIFVKDNGDSWGIVYIGQTHNFYERIFLNLEDHDAWKSECIQKNKATHVAIYEFSGTEQQRIDIETNLRNNYTGSPCNKQLTT